jgi:pimeloyl-ACP methyl ester carboxylesterase
MTMFALIHGGGDVGWSWHLVAAELRRRGHDCVTPDLPCDREGATLDDYADTVVEAIAGRGDLVVVGHSYGAFTAPLVAARVPAEVLVLVAGMIPAPGEPPADWWANTGHADAVRARAERDGGLTGSDDPFVAYFHDVPRALAEEAQRRQRGESDVAYTTPWPLAAWPDVPTRFVVCTEDRVLPAEFMRRVVADRLAVEPDDIASGHCVTLSQPTALADLLESYSPVPRRS